jgi:hypothetical protein
MSQTPRQRPKLDSMDIVWFAMFIIVILGLTVIAIQLNQRPGLP